MNRGRETPEGDWNGNETWRCVVLESTPRAFKEKRKVATESRAAERPSGRD